MHNASTWEDERKTDGATIQTYMYLSRCENDVHMEHEHGHM